MYGFHKVKNNGKNYEEFSHPNFLRDQPYFLVTIFIFLVKNL